MGRPVAASPGRDSRTVRYMRHAVDDLIDEITVDAYGPDEQLWAFRQAFEETSEFPFTDDVVGVEVVVSEVDYDGDDRRGLIAVCRRDEHRHAIALLDIVPTATIPTATAQLIAAYRRWAGADPRPQPKAPQHSGRDAKR